MSKSSFLVDGPFNLQITYKKFIYIDEAKLSGKNGWLGSPGQVRSKSGRR